MLQPGILILVLCTCRTVENAPVQSIRLIRIQQSRYTSPCQSVCQRQVLFEILRERYVVHRKTAHACFALCLAFVLEFVGPLGSVTRKLVWYDLFVALYVDPLALHIH